MSTAAVLFFVAAVVANIAIPYFFARDIRRRYPGLWSAIGSPGPTDSFARLVSKTVTGLRRLSADTSIPAEQRAYCLRVWYVLVFTYVCGGAALLIALSSRYGNVAH